ncbi:acetylornithine transaminase [Halobacillus shinanisalinarum]|uniref:Acetylornithine aminotransferase n=1 Tax=Halobacillus shinanisalinarum TaxID=2932258 RepID=A0ABY4H5W1_9BACI|nr:acetylornithine transaminase [Halobacillus shinanisalinarum]UOQ95315.1 acetylornithine transaminase [Halobacillus shinanisalinarum]
MSLFPTYNRFPLTLVSGNGTTVVDDQGKEYLDFVSGIAVCNLGHRPPAVQQAMEEQLNKLWHVSNLYEIPIQQEAAELLTNVTNLDYVFFCNSGAEANEAAIKLARKHTGKEKIITFKQSFHGRTFATMSATGQDKVHEGFGTLLPTFEYLPFNDVEALQQLQNDDAAAIMVEVIQGEGGVVAGTPKFLEAVQQKCQEIGALLIIDEVQTGIGRTGAPFAYQHVELDPDIVTSAKGLGSGFPVGAMIGKEPLAASFNPGSHGSTFGGNPLGMTAVKATLGTVFNYHFLKEVEERGAFFQKELQARLLPLAPVHEIRGQGLMIGIEVNTPVPAIIEELREKGLLAVPAGAQVLRLLPPLNVSYEELQIAAQRIESVLQQSKYTTRAEANVENTTL